MSATNETRDVAALLSLSVTTVVVVVIVVVVIVVVVVGDFVVVLGMVSVR